MTSEQHKAEMITLHSNLMDAQSKVKKDIKFLTERRDFILKNARNGMNTDEKRNYDMFNQLVENSENLLLISQASITKYKNLYNEVLDLVKTDFLPQIKAEFVEYLNIEFNQFIYDSFQKKVATGEFSKLINKPDVSMLQNEIESN